MCLAALAAVVFLAYFSSLQGAFVWDDESLVRDNPLIRDPRFLAQLLFKPLPSLAGEPVGFYRPLQMITYAIDFSIWKSNPFGYHLSNILWHTLAVIGAFATVVALGAQKKIAFFTALLFSLHPLHTEAISYISGRADPMAAAFLLAAFVVYLGSRDHVRPWVLVVLYYLFFQAALFSRENALMLIPIVFLHARLSARRSPPWAFTAASLAAVAIYLAARIHAVGSIGSVSSEPPPGLWERLPGFFAALPNYFRLFMIPTGLHMEYGGILFSWTDPEVMMGVAVFAAAITATFWIRKRDPVSFLGVCWFWLTLLPASHLFPVNAYMAEHWLYLPSIGLSLIFVRAVYRFFSPRVAAAVLCAVAMFWGALTFAQNRVWREPVAFYERVVRYAPHSGRALNNLAKALYESGQKDRLVDILQDAVHLDPKDATSWNNLGNAYGDAGRFAEAQEAYQSAMTLRPQMAIAKFNLACLAGDKLGDRPRAKTLLEEIILMDPSHRQALRKMAMMEAEDGRYENALSYLLKEEPYSRQDAAFNSSLGYVYFQLKKLQDAESSYKKVIALAPDDSDAYNNLSVIAHMTGKEEEARH